MNGIEFNTGAISPIECVKEGWEVIKPDFWLLLGITFVAGLIGGFSMYILLGAMICGMTYAYLKRIDGQSVSFDDLWKGFSWWLPGLVVTAFIVIPLIVVYAVVYVPIIMSAVMGSKLSEDELVTMLIVAGVVDLILIVIMVCVHTLLMFSFPLIVDRNLGAIKAMTTSARAVLKNIGGVVGLIVVNFGLVFLGYLALCVGIYFVIPIIIAGQLVAYRRVFPRLNPQNFNPPPPNAYQGYT
jgi:hypothetical protein